MRGPINATSKFWVKIWYPFQLCGWCYDNVIIQSRETHPNDPTNSDKGVTSDLR